MPAGVAGMLTLPLVVVLALAILYSQVAANPHAAGALRGMGAVAAGLITATGMKLIPALKKQPLGSVACALIAMVIIDSVASFMLTPTALDHPWDRIFNPTMMHLDLHRIFGNLTWAGFGLAGLCAIGWLLSVAIGLFFGRTVS